MNGEVEVAVVGGGAAGIGAARTLHDAGVNCLLIEARSRLGGRAFTELDSGYPLDLGCGWLHSADVNPWTKIAQAQGKTIDKTPPPWMKPTAQPKFSVEDQRAFRNATSAFFRRAEEAGSKDPDVPSSELLEPGDRWTPLVRAVSTYFAGVEPELVSARDFALYEDTEVNWRVVEGYGAAVTAHAQGVPTLLNAVVTRIDHSGKRIQVETAKGVVTASYVIVALPSAIIAQTENLLAPALSDKVEAARNLPLGLADKLFLSLDGAEEFAADSRLYGASDRTETATYHMRPFGRPVIEAYFGGANAWALEKGGVAAFFDFAVGQLIGLLGNDFAKRVKLLGMHLWGGDPFARGSYSYAKPGHWNDRRRLAQPVDDRLFFAGEACSSDFFTTAQGAYRTGADAAEMIMKLRARSPFATKPPSD
jgi:monoamine oxidase